MTCDAHSRAWRLSYSLSSAWWEKKKNLFTSPWSCLIWAKLLNRCLVRRNGETDCDRGWKSRREGKKRGFIKRRKNGRRERKLSTTGAEEKGGKGSCWRKHFTDICSYSGRHKRAWRKPEECWTEWPKSWTRMVYLCSAGVNHWTLPARTLDNTLDKRTYVFKTSIKLAKACTKYVIHAFKG